MRAPQSTLVSEVFVDILRKRLEPDLLWNLFELLDEHPEELYDAVGAVVSELFAEEFANPDDIAEVVDRATIAETPEAKAKEKKTQMDFKAMCAEPSNRHLIRSGAVVCHVSDPNQNFPGVIEMASCGPTAGQVRVFFEQLPPALVLSMKAGSEGESKSGSRFVSCYDLFVIRPWMGAPPKFRLSHGPQWGR